MEKFYRGMARSHWEEVQCLGYLPVNESGRLYFTTDIYLARWYARYWTEINHESGSGVVVSLPFSAIDAGKIRPDEYGFSGGGRTEFYFIGRRIPVDEVDKIK